MKKIIILLFGLLIKTAFARAETNPNQLFTTSKCFDLIASLQYFDHLKEDSIFHNLTNDSVFIQNLNDINRKVTASKLCNFYATFNGNRNDADSCIIFFNSLKENIEATSSDADWIKDIVNLQPQLSICLSAIHKAGYATYWETKVKPELDKYIQSYPVRTSLLDTIHTAMTEFSGSDELSTTHSKTYVMRIDNAFNLSDESFCCTPLLLDVEMEKQFRLDFIKVYIHENLHRLQISESLMQKLEELMEDDFYRENENIARSHNEGKNEAFVVAAEVFISHNIGRRDNKSVYSEFKEYIDGSLVLAPIIYSHLNEKRKAESLNDFILRLFDKGTIKVGSIKREYEKSMKLIEIGI